MKKLLIRQYIYNHEFSIDPQCGRSLTGEEWFIHYLEQNSCPWQETI